jgi:hypothetical protein
MPFLESFHIWNYEYRANERLQAILAHYLSEIMLACFINSLPYAPLDLLWQLGQPFGTLRHAQDLYPPHLSSSNHRKDHLQLQSDGHIFQNFMIHGQQQQYRQRDLAHAS